MRRSVNKPTVVVIVLLLAVVGAIAYWQGWIPLASWSSTAPQTAPDVEEVQE